MQLIQYDQKEGIGTNSINYPVVNLDNIVAIYMEGLKEGKEIGYHSKPIEKDLTVYLCFRSTNGDIIKWEYSSQGKGYGALAHILDHHQAGRIPGD